MAAVPELASEPRTPAGRSHRPDPRQGVFETMLAVDGRPVELDAHLARLEQSLKTLFPTHPLPNLTDVPSERDPYRRLSDGTSVGTGGEGDGLGSMRITVAPGGGGALAAAVKVRPLEPGTLLDGPPVALHSLSLAGGLGEHKWVDRSLLDEAQARLPTDTLPLIVDRDGAVLEASRANVFATRDGALFTPPLDGRILPGVTRARVIRIAAAAGLEVQEAELSRDDLLAADEVFLTGSVRGIERVRALDGTALAQGGEIASGLAAELRGTWLRARVG
jgi:para-aminobenzoate synthetase / 4-amino-4-deoxychorismate lyase